MAERNETQITWIEKEKQMIHSKNWSNIEDQGNIEYHKECIKLVEND